MHKVKTIVLALLVTAAPAAAQDQAASAYGDFSLSSGAVYGGSGYSYGYNIAVDSTTAGGPFIYVRGQADAGGMIMKYGRTGLMISSATLPSQYNSYYVSYSALVVDYAGSVYAVGSYWDSVAYKDTLLLRKFAPDLRNSADYTYAYGTGSFSPRGAAADKSGVYIAAQAGGQAALLKFTGTDVSSVAVFGESYYPIYNGAVGVDGAGNAYVTAMGGSPYLPEVFKFDAGMHYAGSAGFPAASFPDGVNNVNGMAVSPAGEVFLLANDYSGGNGGDCAVHKMAAMAYVSSATFDSGGYDWCSAVAVSTAGHVVLAGYSQNGGNGDYLTVKLDKDLNFETFYAMDGGSYDYAYAVALDSAANVYVTGNSDRYNGFSYVSNIATVRYSAAGMGNRAPLLSWAGYPDFSWNGVMPQSGVAGDVFRYRIKYSDPDGDAPAAGYPRVHVYNNGSEIAGSPFAMTKLGGTSPLTGELYGAGRALPQGSSYSYNFEALDSNAAPLAAIGYPVTNTMYGPRVGLGFAGGFAQPGGLVYDNGGYITPLAVAVDTISAGGPIVYELGTIANNSSGYAANTAGAANAGAANTAGGGTRGDYLILKSTVPGGQAMARIYSSTAGAMGYAGAPADLALDRAGNVYTLGGFTDDTLMPALVVNKYDSALAWKSSATCTLNYPSATAMTIAQAGDIYALGGYYDMTAMSQDLFLARFDAGMVLRSTAAFGSASGGARYYDTPADITTDKDGNVFIAGYYSDSSGYNNWVIAKYTPDLVFVSSAVFDGMGQVSNDAASAIAADPYGNVFVSGYTNNGMSNDMVTVKYDNALNYLALAFFNGGSAGTANALAADAQGNVYVAGYADAAAQQSGYYGAASGGSAIGLKYDNDLVLRSSAAYSQGYNYGKAVAVDAGGAAYIMGSFNNYDSGYYAQGLRTLRRALPENSRSLTVAVGTSTPRVGVNVGLIPFPSGGSPDVSFMTTGRTGADGKFSWPVRPGLNYLVAISSPGYSPTVKDQIADPLGKYMVSLQAAATKQYYLNPIPAANQGATLKVALSGLVPGYNLMGEVFFTQTGERVAYGVFTATSACGTMEIYNVPASAAAMLSVTVSVPGRLAVTQPVPFSLPGAGEVRADMAAAMPPQGTYEAGTSTVTAFTGFVGDNQGNALKDVKVQISRYAAGCMSNCQPTYLSATYTDLNGRFAFQSIPEAGSYNLYIMKQGYKVPETGALTLPMLNAWYSLEKATYTVRGYVRYNGTPVPYAEVKAWGDGNVWSGTDSYSRTWHSAAIENSAYTDGDGYFVMEGLSDGNIRLNVSQPVWADINQGPDGLYNTADDIRITVSSAGASAPLAPVGNPCAPGRVWVLDSTGACKGVQPYVFSFGTGASDSGRINGYVTFTATYTITPENPLVIAKSSAIVIMAQEQCNGDCPARKIGLAVISGALTSDTTYYSMHVASGTAYWTNVLSNEWGKVSSFGSDLSLASTDTVQMDFSLVKAGSLTCKVKLPDGTFYIPDNGSGVEIEASGKNVSADDGDSLDNTGAAKFPNLPAGLYNVTLRPNTTDFIWPTQTIEDVSVVAGRNTDLVFSLEEGLAVQPRIFSLPEISTPSWKYLVIPLPSGTKMNQKRVTDLFFGRDQFSFSYSTATASWDTKYMAPGQYDFYLLLGAQYNPGGGGEEPVSYDQFANFIGKARNVSIQASESNPNLGTMAQPIPIEILGSIGQDRIAGTIKGAKIFTDQDYAKIFASFESEIQSLIPAVMLYDTAGDFRGFSHALPSAAAIMPFEAAIMAKSSASVVSLLNADPLRYMVWGLPPGSYTAVFANPNYPPVPVNITLPADETKNFDFDAQPLAVGAISGVVRSSAAPSVPLPNASVYLKHRTVEKLTKTDANGAFSFANLPQGIYKLEVSRDGFVTTGEKTSLAGSLSASDNVAFDLYMLPSTSTITGTVLIGGGLGGGTAKAGIKVTAYDETLNTGSPAVYLPKLQAQTDDAGAFELSGIIPGDVYKVSAAYAGKPMVSVEVTAGVGVTAIPDPIVLVDANPQVTVKIRKSQESDRKVDVLIKSPKELINAPRCSYNLGTSYDPATAVSLSLRLDPDNTYVGKFTVSADRSYNVHVEAFDDSMGDDFLKMVKDVVYDPSNEARTDQYIQQAASEGGEISLDAENEEYSGIELEVGALTVSSGTADLSGLVGGFFSSLPSVRTVKTAKGNASVTAAIQGLMASEVYNFDLSNVQPNKPFTLNLKYDKERALNTGALRIYQYDAASGSWKEIPGNYTVDPMTGVVAVDVSSLDLAYEGNGGTSTPLGRKRFGMSAVSGGRYRPSSTSASSQSGKFAVFTAKPPTGTAYTSAEFDYYNMPNPFSLKAKTVNVSSDGGAALAAGAYSTRGTLIKYHLPASKSGSLKFVIYNLAGEKVRQLDEGYRAGGQVYYSEWDGKNDTNQDCASGVYFMLAYLDGDRLGNKAHKMAIIK